MARRRSLVHNRKRQVGRLQARISGRIFDSIEAERGNLLKVESLLSCLTDSMEHEHDPETRTHYPDVAQVACDLVRQSIDRLDSLNLARLINRRGVKEEQNASRDPLRLALIPPAVIRDPSYSELHIRIDQGSSEARTRI